MTTERHARRIARPRKCLKIVGRDAGGREERTAFECALGFLAEFHIGIMIDDGDRPDADWIVGTTRLVEENLYAEFYEAVRDLTLLLFAMRGDFGRLLSGLCLDLTIALVRGIFETDKGDQYRADDTGGAKREVLEFCGRLLLIGRILCGFGRLNLYDDAITYGYRRGHVGHWRRIDHSLTTAFIIRFDHSNHLTMNDLTPFNLLYVCSVAYFLATVRCITPAAGASVS